MKHLGMVSLSHDLLSIVREGIFLSFNDRYSALVIVIQVKPEQSG
jgi:hypothetical protein